MSAGAPVSTVETLQRRYLSGTFAELCRIESPSGSERACGERVIAELRALGVEVHEDGAAAAVGSDCGNLLARIPAARRGSFEELDETPRRSLLLCAHLDTVPLAAPVEPVLVDGVWENANEGILGADNKAAVAVLLALARHVSRNGRRGRPRAAVHGRARRSRWRARWRSTPRAAQRVRLRLRPRLADRRGRDGLADPLPPRRSRCAARPRTRASAPRRGAARSSRRRARSPRCRPGAWTSGTTVNVGTIAGGSAINVVPERCTLVGRGARARGRARGGGRSRRSSTASHEAANMPDCDCDVEVDVQRTFTGYGLSGAAPAIKRRGGGAAGLRPRAGARSRAAAARTPTR